MPYITPEQRAEVDPALHQLAVILVQKESNEVIGFLNYIITVLVLTLWTKTRRYFMANALMGCLTCAASEFYRKHVVPYENEKAKENGEIGVLAARNGQVTQIDFWECECRTHHIHPLTCHSCSRCERTQRKSPRAFVDDVRKMQTGKTHLGCICR
jgi:hypothetical protein